MMRLKDGPPAASRMAVGGLELLGEDARICTRAGVWTVKFKKHSNSRNRFVGGRAPARQERGSHSSPSHTCRRRFWPITSSLEKRLDTVSRVLAAIQSRLRLP